MARLVLTDSSPLVGLSRVGGVGWLRELFGSVEMTPSVRRELGEGGAMEQAILDAMDQGWILTRPHDPHGPERPPHLGDGEWTTILAAREHDGPALVLLDDLLAQREAKARGVSVAGTAAVVGLAQRRGVIDSAREVFEGLLRSDFRIAPEVIRAVLEELDSES